MTTQRFTMRVLATMTLWAGFGLTGYAQPAAISVQQAFETRPRQPGIAVTTPAPDQIARHKVEPIKDKNQTVIGYVVRDADGKPVRQFVSYDGKAFNIVAFYVNGQESYRETYPPAPNEPYQFRWLGPNGGKWGLDRDRDGKVDEWVVISPEEASQELMQAVIARDPKRLEALLPSEESLKGVGLAPAEIKRIQEKSAGAVKRLGEAAAALKLTAEAKWVHLELGIPQTTPADAFGGRDDQVVHKNGTILIQDGKETKLLQTGELIMIGRSWKLVEGPLAGPAHLEPNAVAGNGDAPLVTPEIAEFVSQLDALDKGAAELPPNKLAEYYAKRAGILEQIVQTLKPEQQTGWAKLLIDSLASASEVSSDGSTTHERLKQLKDAFVAQPQNPLGAYASFRLISAENGMSMAKAKTGAEINAAQEKYRTALEGFVNAFPKSEDAGEAIMRLAMSYEFVGGKDGETKAKTWCEHLMKNYAGHHHAAKAAGIVRRLDSEGKPLELAGPNMATGQPFSAQQLAGKPIVVFYWASWSGSLAEDVKKLKDLAGTYGPKGLEIVSVALDDDPKTASDAIQKHGIPGTHLHVAGGLDRSPLATSYGILVAPHLFVVDKDGKIAKRSAEMATLEDDVKKLTMP
jgi:thiol-disulfide isomerase/thioredoxin